MSAQTTNLGDQFLGLLGLIVLWIMMIFMIALPCQYIWNLTLVNVAPVQEIEYIDMVRLLVLVRLFLPIPSVPSSGNVSKQQ